MPALAEYDSRFGRYALTPSQPVGESRDFLALLAEQIQLKVVPILHFKFGVFCLTSLPIYAILPANSYILLGSRF
jgi:hypothetical protein